ncbi:PREDICTED: NAD-dependent protein deacylase SRT2 isoform X2 [Theobroma cacao]|uniref:NAD-dependent protein deacylase n=1 Tax=Theobroma cacao TaxID=3641 RepID=A0AB32VPN2_THECC|nr:PREDICTED: NAD-dependent protein deacylase SRT2 isoform X2 [Theobroma cacao]
MLSRSPWHFPLFISASTSTREVLGSFLTDILQSSGNFQQSVSQGRRVISSHVSVKFVQTSCHISVPRVSVGRETQVPSKFLKDRKMVPNADPPSIEDVSRLYQLFDQSTKLVVLTGAGISTECGIPDYRSPNGAYSSGFKPITHQEFVRSSRARRRYWARSYAGWRRFTAAKPGAAHVALASLEKAGRINFMITQNVDRLHHRAGSNPLELHGTVYSVICLDCGFSFCRNLFQDEVKALNPKWAAAIESLDHGSPGSDKSFGMKQRPDGDIEIDEKFWEEDFHIPTCQRCKGTLKPDVVFFGDNVPKERADKAMEVSRECDGFLVLGSSLMTMSAYRLVRAAHKAGATTAIVNIGTTRADDIVSLKLNARLGEILPRVLNTGSLGIPALE